MFPPPHPPPSSVSKGIVSKHQANQLAIPFGVTHDEAPAEIKDSLKKPRAKSQDPKLDTTKILAPFFRVNRWIMDAALNVAPPWNLTHIEALNKLSKWNNSTRIVQRTSTVLCLHLRKR